MAHHRHLAPPQRLRRIALFTAQFFFVLSAFFAFTVIAVAPHAQARPSGPVTAGDVIVQDGTRCTLGYVYRVAGHTMGVSAGHCASAGSDEPIKNLDAGVSGRTVSISFTPGRDGKPPQKDWWLIDFGDVAWSDRIANTNYQVITYVNARESDWVCHFGAGSKREICGFVSSVDNPLITVTQTGQSGDSGGPTYMKINDNYVAIVGLWQGHFQQPYPGGYAMSLPAALTYFRAHTT
ncbi:hypothetical protein ACWDTP_04690 [Mycobacterium sp. NPDC003449]